MAGFEHTEALRRRLDLAADAPSEKRERLLYVVGLILLQCHQRLVELDQNVKGQRKLENMLDEMTELLFEVRDNKTTSKSRNGRA